MYSRNMWENREPRRQGYTIPPGYDGNRFRRRRTSGNDSTVEEDEVIIIPDSGFVPVEDEPGDNELSVGGIPTNKGTRRRMNSVSGRKNSEDRKSESFKEEVLCGQNENDSASDTGSVKEPSPQAIETHAHMDTGKLSGILEKFGFSGELSKDDLLLCAIIFIIASDKDQDERDVGDILLILALLLGLR